ncbi:hypothetical protein OESDEN_15574 [Oesophagostomum dentatum]|uniref:Uncharacterized protein n=1 Tax=Oesophagostomum dentatum TaxID=61180 RepID=A0A0B1SIH2_OESDE|nr:hypothetical protein OESDEN_15574 [Oesophagostomum dentatum]
MRPNLSTAGQHKPAIQSTSLSEDVKPSNFALMSVKAEAYVDAKQHFHSGDGEEADRRSPAESITLSSTTDDEDSHPVQSSHSEISQEKEDAAPTINGSKLLTRAKKLKPNLNKSATPSEPPTPAQDEVTVIEEDVVEKSKEVHLESAKPTEHVLKRGKRSLIKPKILVGAEEPVSSDKPQNATETNQDPKDNNTAADAVNASDTHLLRRGKRPFAKPVIASTTTKTDNALSSQKEVPASQNTDAVEKSDAGGTVLKRGRKPLIKPKLLSSESEGKDSPSSSKNASDVLSDEVRCTISRRDSFGTGEFFENEPIFGKASFPTQQETTEIIGKLRIARVEAPKAKPSIAQTPLKTVICFPVVCI